MKLSLLLLLSVLAYTACASVVPPLYSENDGGIDDIWPARLRDADSAVSDVRDDGQDWDFYPNWSPLDPVGGPTFVTIKGCGFRTFSEAVCVFDWQFTSELSWIEDDNTVICQLPRFARTDFMSVPFDSRLDIVFDGNPKQTMFVGPFRWGPQVDCETAISPERGYTSGSYQVTLYGEGFNDQALPDSILDVWFDDQKASGCSSSSDGTMITCSSIPAVDEIHRDALVSITWGSAGTRTTFTDDVESFLHATTLFHYGPYVSDVSACVTYDGMAYVSGGSAGVGTLSSSFGNVVINGEGFNDPIFNKVARAPNGGSSMPTNEFMIEITFSKTDPSDSELGGAITRQIFPSAITDTTITFAAPDFTEFTDDDEATSYNNVMGAIRGSATATVYYRQHAGQQSVSTPQRDSVATVSFMYGPVVTGVGSSGSTAASAREWHQGGGEEVCVHGCGFNEYAEADLDIRRGGSSICVSGSLSRSNTLVCCTLDEHDCTVEGRTFEVDLFINAPSGATDLTLPGDSPGWNDAIIGPILFDHDYENAYVNAASWSGRSISGKNLRFTSGTSGDLGGWGTGLDVTGGSCDVTSIVINSDSALTVNYQTNTCDVDQTNTFTIVFDAPSTSSTSDCNIVYRDTFGPTCDSRISHGLVQGGYDISVTGYGFRGYAPRIVLCDSAVDAACDTQNDLDEDLNVGSTGLSNNNGVFTLTAETTPYLDDIRDLDRFRGRRFWGQWFDVNVAVNSERDGEFTGGTTFEFDGNCADGGSTSPCSSNVLLKCGQHRFGPVTSAITPCSGGIDGDTAVTVSAINVADSWFNKGGSGVTGSDSPHLTAFGSLVGAYDTTRSGSAVSTMTYAERHEIIDDNSGLVSVLNVFDACNMTSPVTNNGKEFTIYWGPRFVSVAKDDMSPFDTTKKSQNVHLDSEGDLWGAHPAEEDYLYMWVYGMGEWCGDNTDCESDYVRVLVDGVFAQSVFIESGDLHATDNSPSLVRVDLPQRPYGTTAKVCILFDYLESATSGPDENVFDFNANSWQQDIDFSRMICADEKVHYEVKALGITAGGAKATSGGGTTTFALLGYDDSNWEVSQIYVGGFPAGVDIGGTTVNSIIFNCPSDIAEFNTDMSVRVQWNIPSAYYDNDNSMMRTCDEYADSYYDDHWISWVTDKIHFGPTCAITGDVGLYGDSDRSSDTAQTVTLSTTFLQDCPDESPSGLCPDLYGGNENEDLCNVPVHGGLEQYPYSGDVSDVTTTRGRGNKLCYHRFVYAFGQFFANAASAGDVSTSTNPNLANSIEDPDDTDQQDGGSTDYDVQLPSSLSCGKFAVALFFPDALVTDEARRWIQCDGEVHYGPHVTGFNSVWFNDDEDTAYGYGYSNTYTDAGKFNQNSYIQVGSPRESKHDDHLYTITGTDFDDLSLSDRSLEPVVTGTGWSNVVHADYTAADDEVIVAVPIRTFGTEVTGITVSWGSVCVFNTGFKFHYGPVLYSSDRDNCGSPVELGDGTQTVKITGRAFECCGFQSLVSADTYLSSNFGDTNCLFKSGEYVQDEFDHFSTELDGAGVDAGEGKLNSHVTCNIPANVQAHRRLYNFGLAFGADPAFVCDSGTGNDKCSPSSPGDYVLGKHVCEDGHSMDICYGPKGVSTTYRVRMSGYSDSDCTDDPTLDIDGFPTSARRIDFDVTGTKDFDDSQVTADGGQCQFNINGASLSPADMDGDHTCVVPIWYKECGQSMTGDTVYIIHDTDAGPYTEKEFTYPVKRDSDGADWEDETGPIVMSKIQWGPVATLSDINDDEIQEVSDTELRVYTQSSSSQSIDVTVDMLRDWSCASGDDRYALPNADGNGIHVMALFGNRRSVDSSYGDQFTVNSLDFPSFSTGSPSGTFTFYIPSGNFGEEGQVRVIIDPHFDKYTILDDDSDEPEWQRGFGTDEIYQWHWVPAVTGLSRTWSVPGGMETVTVYGWGFSSDQFYDRAVCYFGSEEGIQADIISNTMVVCQVPQDHAPGSVTVSVYLNDGQNCDNVYEYCGASEVIGDTVTAPTQFTFVGVTDAWPLHGPVHGNTPVQIEAVGLENYVSVNCVWHFSGGEERIPIQEGNVCVSPSTDAEGLVKLTLEGTWWSVGRTEQVWSDELGCFWFDFGYPTIQSVSPSSVYVSPVNDVNTVVTVSGRYFNGGLLDATLNGTGVYDCLWAVGDDTTTDLPRELGSAANWGRVLRTSGVRVATVNDDFGKPIDSFDIACPLPSQFGVYGSYPFEIEFSDGSRTANNFDFDVMVSDILSLDAWEADPDWFDEVDGLYVDELAPGLLTLTGAGFFGGRVGNSRHTSSYLVRFGIDSRFMSPQEYIYAVADVVDDNSLVVAKLTRSLENNTDEEPISNIPVAVSVDGGYSFSEEISLPYRKNDDLRECFENSASALSFSVLLVLAAIAAFFF